MKSEEIENIGVAVYMAAKYIFEECGFEKDFCIQSQGMYHTVFGGLNRVIYNPLLGFKVDRSYCDEKFLANFEAAKTKLQRDL